VPRPRLFPFFGPRPALGAVGVPPAATPTPARMPAFPGPAPTALSPGLLGPAFSAPAAGVGAGAAGAGGLAAGGGLGSRAMTLLDRLVKAAEVIAKALGEGERGGKLTSGQGAGGRGPLASAVQARPQAERTDPAKKFEQFRDGVQGALRVAAAAARFAGS
jgi:hypothetical protein